MAEREASTSESAKFTRTSAACMACRTRKQKCSGERPQCAQCRINKARCEWPQQQKRGPPKQYTAALEARLFETENILAALLSQVSDAQLSSGFHRLEELRQQETGLTGVTPSAGTLTYARKNKFGPRYWSDYPLHSAGDVRRWSEDRMLRALDVGGPDQRTANTTTPPNQSPLYQPNIENQESIQIESAQTRPYGSVSHGFSLGGTQYEEQPEVTDHDEFNEGMDMTGIGEEDQASPADLRRPTNVQVVSDTEHSVPQRRQDRGADPGDQRTSSGTFDSAYIW